MSILRQPLENHGFVQIEPLHSQEDIHHFNQAFDSIFAKQEQSRRYVDCWQMFELGVLEKLFNPALQKLIYQMQPDAVFYHCHAYEIDANQSKSHILSENQCDGWHRDWDCPLDLAKSSNLQQVSLFIYLTDVHEGNGGFEVSDKPFTLWPNRASRSNFYQIQGTPGHTFLFNRIAYHRASPNTSDVARRVIKISFQGRDDFNSRLPMEQFANLRQHLPFDQFFLRQLVADSSVTPELVQKHIENLSDIDDVKLLPNPQPRQIKLGWLHNIRAYLRDLKYFINLKRERYYQ